MKSIRVGHLGWGGSLDTARDLLARHSGTMLRHLTLPRFLNAALLGCELVMRRTTVRSRPLVIKIEPTNICNFQCPGCRTGSGEDKSPRGQINFEDYKRIIDKTHKYAFKVILYMWGEPLINKDIFRMIRYAASKNLAVQISSNMNVFRSGYAEEIVDSGLEHLIVAMDGVSQGVYEKYRVGGKVEKVVKNVELIMEARKQRGARFPVLEMQYIVFPHNRDEIDKAEMMAERLGADTFTVIDSTINTNPAGARLRNGLPRKPDKCNSLWMMACFNWDGSFSPCCDSVDDSFGNVLEEDLKALWNSDKIRKSRSLHTSNPTKEGPATKCSRCRIYGSYVTFLPEGSSTNPENTHTQSAGNSGKSSTEVPMGV